MRADPWVNVSLPHLAYIGLLPGVDPHVGHQFVLGIEGPRAPVAAVPVTGKLLAALPELLVAGLDVLHQRVSVRELLAATAPPALVFGHIRYSVFDTFSNTK